MIDAEKFAALICDWCLEVTPGQGVLVASSTAAEPLLAALYAALLDRGAWPQLDVEVSGQERLTLDHARENHFAAVSSLKRVLYEQMDAWVRIRAPANTAELAGVDPALSARWAARQRELTQIRMTKRWLGTLWPTPALAQLAGMSLRDYERFVSAALLLDTEDPRAAWQALHERQQTLVDRLTGAREIRIESAGTDLTLNVADRIWQNSSGRRNMPSGEVFTSPQESSANGTIHFDVPSNPGVEVQGVSLTFRDGEVVHAHAERGDGHLQAQLATDPGARRLGEIGIGTNPGITRATGLTLLDEKIGGTVHLALGASYPECGGVNESAIHWDLIRDLRGGGTITVDGDVLSRDGVFT